MKRVRGNHSRNIEGLKKSAAEKQLAAKSRLDSALQRMIRDRKRINFNTVAKEANVSLSWLYKEENVRQRIQHLRTQYVPKKVDVPKVEHASESSWKAKYNAAVHRNRELREEIERLRRQNEKAYSIIISNNLSVPDNL